VVIFGKKKKSDGKLLATRGGFQGTNLREKGQLARAAN